MPTVTAVLGQLPRPIQQIRTPSRHDGGSDYTKQQRADRSRDEDRSYATAPSSSTMPKYSVATYYTTEMALVLAADLRHKLARHSQPIEPGRGT
jgi:hypothetical protein